MIFRFQVYTSGQGLEPFCELGPRVKETGKNHFNHAWENQKGALP